MTPSVLPPPDRDVLRERRRRAWKREAEPFDWGGALVVLLAALGVAWGGLALEALLTRPGG